MPIHAVTVRVARIPLRTPYRLSDTVFHHFEPIVVEIWDGDGRYGFGEAVISEGYSHETLEGGLRWCRDAAPHLVGKEPGEARALLEPGIADFPSAASSLLSALDVLDDHPLLDVPETTRIPLLDPVHSHEPAALADEVEALLARGFRTLKVKVGFDAHADLARVRRIQTLLDGRAEIRLDANRGFTREDGCAGSDACTRQSARRRSRPCSGLSRARTSAHSPHTSPRNRSQFSPRTLRIRVSLQPRRTIAAVRPGNSPMVASPSGWRGTRGAPGISSRP